MEHSVKVTIKREKDCFVGSNDKGKKWNFPFDAGIGEDISIKTCVASLASAMLSGTIAAHLTYLSSPEITYTLTIDK